MRPFASMQQPADFFCKEFLPEHHRLEAPISFARVVQAGTADPTDRESVSLGGASPLSPTNFTESKPQQTGTGLLIRYGEVATTSGSTNSLPRGVTAACRALTPTVLVRIQARQPIYASCNCDCARVGSSWSVRTELTSGWISRFPMCRMNSHVAEFAEQSWYSASHSSKSLFLFRIQPRPTFRFVPQAAAPRLGCQPCAKTFLRFAKSLIKRVCFQRHEHVVDHY